MTYRGKNTLSTQDALNLSLGHGTIQHYVWAGGSTITGSFFCYQILEDDTVFEYLEDIRSNVPGNLAATGGPYDGLELAAGNIQFGSFISASVGSTGTAVFYEDSGDIGESLPNNVVYSVPAAGGINPADYR